MSEVQNDINTGQARLEARLAEVKNLERQLEGAKESLHWAAVHLAETIGIWVDPDHDPAWLTCPCCKRPYKVTKPLRTEAFVRKHQFVAVCSDCG